MKIAIFQNSNDFLSNMGNKKKKKKDKIDFVSFWLKNCCLALCFKSPSQGQNDQFKPNNFPVMWRTNFLYISQLDKAICRDFCLFRERQISFLVIQIIEKPEDESVCWILFDFSGRSRIIFCYNLWSPLPISLNETRFLHM